MQNATRANSDSFSYNDGVSEGAVHALHAGWERGASGVGGEIDGRWTPSHKAPRQSVNLSASFVVGYEGYCGPWGSGPLPPPPQAPRAPTCLYYRSGRQIAD